MSKPPQPRKKQEEDDLEIQLATVRRKISDEEAEIAELYNLQDAPEKYTRENYLEIHRLPESANTSTEEVVFNLGEALNVYINSTMLTFLTSFI